MQLRRTINICTQEWAQAQALVGGSAGDAPLANARFLLALAEQKWLQRTPARPPPGQEAPQADPAAIVAKAMSEIKVLASEVLQGNTQAQPAPQQPDTMTVNIEEQVTLRAEKQALEKQLTMQKDMADELQD